MLELKYIKQETLSQDDTVINSEEISSAGPLTAGYNLMSERKKLTFTFDNIADGYSLQTLEGALLYVNFAMFLPKGFVYSEPSGPPQAGFNLRLPNTLAGNERIEMFFFANGIANVNSNKNLKCYFIGAADALNVTTEFGIELEYYNTYDEGTYFNNLSKENVWRFLSEYYNQQNFDIIPESVFNSEKEMRAMVYLSSDVVTKQEFTLTEQQNKISNVPSIWTFGSNGFTEFSKSEDTDVVVLLNTATAFDIVYAKLIKIGVNNEIDFITNYDLKENLIDVGSVDNVIKAPFDVRTTIIDGVTYQEITFSIDKELVTSGQNYRLIVTAYEAYTTESAIAISTIISGAAIRPYNGGGIDFSGSLSDIQREFFGNELTCVIEERIKSKVFLDYAYDKWKNNLITRLGLANPTNDIRNYLEFVQVEIYDENYDSFLLGTVRNTLAISTLSKIATNSYSGPDIIATFGTDTSEFEFSFRNRNNANTGPIASYLNGVYYFNQNYITGNQYWGGKDLFIKWRFGFKYPNFQDILEYIQKLHVKDYDSFIEITRIGSTSYFCCPGDVLCYYAEIHPYFAEEFLLINTVESLVLNIEEEENFGGIELPQQTGSYINTQDVVYDAITDQAQFCVDTNLLIINQNWKFSAMAKKNYTY